MIKQIGSIAIFVDQQINEHTGRQFIDHASVQFWDVKHDFVRTVGLSSVVTDERSIWEHVEWSVQQMIDEGYGIDEPNVTVYRSHKTAMKVDFFDTIGQHL